MFVRLAGRPASRLSRCYGGAKGANDVVGGSPVVVGGSVGREGEEVGGGTVLRGRDVVVGAGGGTDVVVVVDADDGAGVPTTTLRHPNRRSGRPLSSIRRTQ